MPLACEVRRPQVLPPRKPIIDTSLVFDAPLWHPGLAVSPFLSKNSGTVHTCTVTGATWGSQGRTFDGIDDNINLGDPAAMEGLAEGTISMWFKPTVNIADTDTVTFLDKGNTNCGFGYQLTGKIEFTLYSPFRALVSNQATWLANVWYFVNLRFGAGGMSIYINNVLDIENLAYVAGFTASATDWTLGCNSAGKWFAPIVMGEVMIHNRSLSLPETTNLQLSTQWRYL